MKPTVSFTLTTSAQGRNILLVPVARAVHPPPATPTVIAGQLGLREHVARHSLAESGATGSAPRRRGGARHLIKGATSGAQVGRRSLADLGYLRFDWL